MTCHKEAFEKQYEFIRKLGSGHFAVVRLCKERSSSKEFAAKCIKKHAAASQEEIEREMKVLERVGDHQNIVNFYGTWDSADEAILLLEHINGGELFTYLSEKDVLSEEEACFFLKQVLQGLKFCHQQKIAHLDIKPENMLLHKSRMRKPTLKIVDFGLAQWVSAGHDVRIMQGTPEFVSPEVLNFDPISLESDIWSVAVTAYILLSGCSPFLGEDDNETYSNIIKVQYNFDEKLFGGTSQYAIDFMKSNFEKNPKKRLTAMQCLQHPWISPQKKKDKMARKKSFIRSTKVLKTFTVRQRWREAILKAKTGNQWSRMVKDSQMAKMTECAIEDQKTAIRSPKEEITVAFDMEPIAEEEKVDEAPEPEEKTEKEKPKKAPLFSRMTKRFRGKAKKPEASPPNAADETKQPGPSSPNGSLEPAPIKPKKKRSRWFTKPKKTETAEPPAGVGKVKALAARWETNETEPRQKSGGFRFSVFSKKKKR